MCRLYNTCILWMRACEEHQIIDPSGIVLRNHRQPSDLEAVWWPLANCIMSWSNERNAVLDKKYRTRDCESL